MLARRAFVTLAVAALVGCGGTATRPDAAGDAAAAGEAGVDAAKPDAGEDGAPADAAPDGLPVWSAPIERCGDGVDDDLDGLTDEDCAPSLWAGVYPPGGGADLGGAGTVAALEADVGRALSVIQTYHGTSPTGVQRVGPDLEAIWAHGATPHLNVEPSGYTTAQYAAAATDPGIDADLQALAAALAAALGAHPDGRLLLTFGAEMNGNWVDWGCLPAAAFVGCYRKAHELVGAALAAASPAIDARRVRWVYGPNSTSSASCGSAAGYYPGHAYVDYLGMSAYRSGTATVADAVVTPARQLLADLSFTDAWSVDRFIVLQTGTRDVSGDDRGAWLGQLYLALRDDPAFLGVIYFNDADWAVSSGAGAPLAGYAAWVSALAALPLADARLDATFAPYFWDVRQADAYYPEIQSLRAAGLTSGCAAAPPQFCPDDPLRRRDAAILLARAFAVAPDGSLPPRFDDVPASDPGFGAIQALAQAGALPGCGATTFCPGDPLRRDALAVALAELAGIAGQAGAARFTDLDGLDPAVAARIETLARVAYVDGCAADRFCPTAPALRAPGAAWIVRTARVPPAPSP